MASLGAATVKRQLPECGRDIMITEGLMMLLTVSSEATMHTCMLSKRCYSQMVWSAGGGRGEVRTVGEDRSQTIQRANCATHRNITIGAHYKHNILFHKYCHRLILLLFLLCFRVKIKLNRLLAFQKRITMV